MAKNISMKITILQIGKTKHQFFRDAEAEFLKRLQAYAEVEVKTLKEAVAPGGQSASPGGISAAREIAKNKEADEIIKNLARNSASAAGGSVVIALDEHGKSMDSQQFASFIRRQKDFGPAHLTFIIGGPYGLAPKVFKEAQLKLSFSAFTFTHEIIRTLLLEQLYRAFTILQGKTYHY